MSTFRFDARAGRKTLLIIDGFSLVLVLLFTEWVLNSPQTFLFDAVWVLTALSGLYLSGRYNEIFRYTGSHALRALTGVSLSVVISYPFLSGIDVSRVLFLMLLLLENVLLLSLIAFIKMHSSLMVNAHTRKILVLSVSGQPPQRFSAMKELLQGLGHQVEWVSCGKLCEKLSLDFSLWDVVVYDESITEHNQLPIYLLEEKIKGCKVIDFVSFYSSVTGRIPLDMVDESVLLKTGQSFFENKALQRLIRIVDLLAGIILCMLAFLPMVLIAILVKVESPGPVIFRQERLGRNMKPFILYKFRSMPGNAESDGPQWATRNDQRATRFGRFLRSAHFDELPQIINLLRGDISLIGPRPIRQYFADRLGEVIPYYHLRFLIKPGITGWAQVKGPYGVNREEQRIKHEMDLFYIQNASIPLNLYLLVSTFRVIGLHAGFE